MFEYAILHHPKPTKEQAERNETPKSVVLVPPTSALAATDAQVSILAARAIAEGHIDHIEDIEIIVRPF